VGSGDVVLLHDGGGNRSQTLAALQQVLAGLSARGFRFGALCRG
jgi:peptidoglycan/xylan/chitin deacetylase (PgdA/CDA1 family)